MKKLVLDSVRFLVNSNIWIALATVCLYQLSLMQVGVELQLNATVFLLFFSTLLIYNVFRIIGHINEKKQWYLKHYNYTTTLSFFSLVASLIALYFFEKEFLPIIFLAGILTLLYVGPLTKKTNKKFNLRKFWFLKSILVALVWVLLTVVLPLIENNFSGNDLLFYSLEKFFFILGITIPYDIKDMQEDESDRVKTIAIKFGVKRTKWISNIFLFFGLLIAFIIDRHFFKAVLFIYLVAMYLNHQLDESKDELWYTFFIDGTIILYFIVVWLVSYLSLSLPAF